MPYMNNIGVILPVMLTLIRGQDVACLSMLPILVKGQGIRRQGVKLLGRKHIKKQNTTHTPQKKTNQPAKKTSKPTTEKIVRNSKLVLRNRMWSVVATVKEEFLG